jgi:hypothetical protein
MATSKAAGVQTKSGLPPVQATGLTRKPGVLTIQKAGKEKPSKKIFPTQKRTNLIDREVFRGGRKRMPTVSEEVESHIKKKLIANTYNSTLATQQSPIKWPGYIISIENKMVNVLVEGALKPGQAVIKRLLSFDLSELDAAERALAKEGAGVTITFKYNFEQEEIIENSLKIELQPPTTFTEEDIEEAKKLTAEYLAIVKQE